MNNFIYRLIFIGATCLTLTVSAQDNAPKNADTDTTNRLEAARERLEQAAREVAELSGEVAGDHVIHFINGIHAGKQRAMLGINIGGATGDDKSKSDGVEILAVSPGSPADQAGLKAGDVILSLDGEPLAGANGRDSSNKLLRRMEAIEPGTKVTVEYIRNGKTAEARIETVPMQPPMFNFAIGDRDFNFRGPEAGTRWEGPLPFFREFLSRQWGELELVEITPELGKYFGTEEGVLVIRAPKDDKLKLQDGDIIVSIDGRKPNNPNHAMRILRSYAPGEALTMEIMRDKRRQKLDVTVPGTAGDDEVMHFELQRPMAAPQPGIQQMPQGAVMVHPKGRGI